MNVALLFKSMSNVSMPSQKNQKPTTCVGNPEKEDENSNQHYKNIVKCHFCGKIGHFVKNSFQTNKNKEFLHDKPSPSVNY